MADRAIDEASKPTKQHGSQVANNQMKIVHTVPVQFDHSRTNPKGK